MIIFVQVQTFLAALRALSRREVQYGAYATSEEVGYLNVNTTPRYV